MKALSVLCMGIVALALQSCEKDLYQPQEEKSTNDFFDFATAKDVQLNIDFGFKDYQVVFELYEENPITQNAGGEYVKTDKEPLFRSYTTAQSTYEHEINLSSSVKEVYLYSDYVGISGPVKLSVTDGKISFNQKEYLSQVGTRAVTTGGHIYPDAYKTLGDWNANGRPDYLKSERKYDIPSKYLNTISKMYSELKADSFPVKYPQYFGENPRTDIHLIKESEVDLIFLYSGAAYNNVVGYYTYPTNNPPKSRAEITDPVIAFPRITATFKGDNEVNYGQQVQLKYWNGTEFKDKFPAGVSIGWFIVSDAFRPYSQARIVEDETTATFYSTDATFARYQAGHEFLSKDIFTQRPVALLHDPESQHMISLCWEDRMSKDLSCNYYDAVFFINVIEANALENPPLEPPVTGEDSDIYTSYQGTLIFEDLWPAKGDFDMNDLVIEYRSKHYINKLDPYYVVKIEDEFIPKHDGATFTNGFGFQYAGLFNNETYVTKASDIASIKVETASGITSKFMNGQNLEPGQTTATVILFDNLKDALGKDAVFNVTTEFNGRGIYDRHVRPPYNPFIIVKTNEGRGREVHLPNRLPTSLADTSLLGTSHDKSDPSKGLYYVSDPDNEGLQYPFAAYLSNKTDFYCSPETTPVDVTYPDFEKWVRSNGSYYTTWFNNPR